MTTRLFCAMEPEKIVAQNAHIDAIMTADIHVRSSDRRAGPSPKHEAQQGYF